MPQAPEDDEGHRKRWQKVRDVGATALAGLVPIVTVGAVAIAAVRTPAPKCASEPRPTATSTTERPIVDTQTLAKRYEPTVEMSILDRFWPVSVQSVLRERSWLGGSVRLVSGASSVVEPKLGALKASDSKESYLDYPAQLSDKVAQMRVFLRGIDVPSWALYDWPTNLTRYAERTAQIYFYDAGTMCTFAGKQLHGYHALEYWFFYPFNYYPLTVRATKMLADPLATDKSDVDFHEGDWEHVTLLLAPGDMPAYVWMARHSKEGVLIPWDQLQKDRDGHFIVYPAFGGHPSYPDCGAHQRALLAGVVYDYVVCGPGLYTFAGALTPLVDLGSVSWSCWLGHFGTTVGTQASSNADDPTGQILVAGPGTPLRQGENTDACARASG